MKFTYKHKAALRAYHHFRSIYKIPQEGLKLRDLAEIVAERRGLKKPPNKRAAIEMLFGLWAEIGTGSPGRPNRPPGHADSATFYFSAQWKRLRYEALKKCGRACLVCGGGPKDGKVLHVDHIKPRSLFPDLALDPDNLQVLCEDCNLGKSNTDSIDWRL